MIETDADSYMTSEDEVLLRIKITGQPGSGGSTLGGHLEKNLHPQHIEKISGGRLRRAEAYLWHEYKAAQLLHPSNFFSELYLWQSFEKEFSDCFQQTGFEGVLTILEPYFAKPSNNAILNEFSRAQELYSPQATIWDVVTDTYLLQQTEQTDHSYVLESKLAVVLDQIEELQRYVAHDRVWALPAFNILLVVDPAVSAQRITKREQTPVTVDDILARRQFDARRYGTIYHSAQTGQPLTQTDLEAASYVIDTSYLSEEEVLTEALLYVLTQLNQIMATQPEKAQAWVTVLTELLQKPRILPPLVPEPETTPTPTLLSPVA